MTCRIVRKPIMGIYNSLDFEIIKIKDMVPKNIIPKEQQIVDNKLHVKKDSKKQNKNNKNHKNIEWNKTPKNNSIVSKKDECFVVGHFRIKKLTTYLYYHKLDNQSYFNDDNLNDYDEFNNIETEYYFSEESDTDSYDTYGDYDY